MAKVEKFDTTDGKLGWLIWCPGCKTNHVFVVGFTSEDARKLEIERRKERFKGEPHQPCPVWTFNGNIDKPTFRASMLVSWSQSEGKPRHVCHSFVTDGKIQFLDDCTHHLKGKTVELPDTETHE